MERDELDDILQQLLSDAEDRPNDLIAPCPICSGNYFRRCSLPMRGHATDGRLLLAEAWRCQRCGHQVIRLAVE